MMREMDLVSLGGRGDGITDNSPAFERALAALNAAGGGTLTVGRGIWRTGPLELFSHCTLCLEEGAVLSFIAEPARYAPVFTRWEGVRCFAMHPCVFAKDAEHIRVEGTGRLDGNGRFWWELLREKRQRGQRFPETSEERALARLNPDFETQSGGGGGRNTQFLRPPLVQFYQCADVRLSGVTLVNSPFWTVHPVFCRGVTLSGLSIVNPPDAPNTDGIDIDSCEDVEIEGCRVSVGDDGIALKSGSGRDGIEAGRPTCRVNIRDCTVADGHGGVVIGSETAGGISAVLARDCRFRGTDRGIRVKTRRGRGGRIRDLEFRDLTMENNLCPLSINMYYRCGAEHDAACFTTAPLPLTPETPSIARVTVRGLRATGCRASAGFIAGLPESPVEQLRLEDCAFSTDETSAVSPNESDMFLGLPPVTEKSFRLLNVKAPELRNITVQGPEAPFIYR
ncbi:MAG: glycoside hydrolase family 28 protein [Spirochaetaceae bacterium]|jgi:polygalacturonase|nr:glycoside hydrolase family 28 protein [Spirochaetaceae bacterium]